MLSNTTVEHFNFTQRRLVRPAVGPTQTWQSHLRSDDIVSYDVLSVASMWISSNEPPPLQSSVVGTHRADSATANKWLSSRRKTFRSITITNAFPRIHYLLNVCKPKRDPVHPLATPRLHTAACLCPPTTTKRLISATL